MNTQPQRMPHDYYQLQSKGKTMKGKRNEDMRRMQAAARGTQAVVGKTAQTQRESDGAKATPGEFLLATGLHALADAMLVLAASVAALAQDDGVDAGEEQEQEQPMYDLAGRRVEV